MINTLETFPLFYFNWITIRDIPPKTIQSSSQQINVQVCSVLMEAKTRNGERMSKESDLHMRFTLYTKKNVPVTRAK